MFKRQFFLIIPLVFTLTGLFSCGDATHSNNAILKNATAKPINKNEDSLIISLVFGGDLMGHGPQIRGAWDDSLNDYN